MGIARWARSKLASSHIPKAACSQAVQAATKVQEQSSSSLGQAEPRKSGCESAALMFYTHPSRTLLEGSLASRVGVNNLSRLFAGGFLLGPAAATPALAR